MLKYTEILEGENSTDLYKIMFPIYIAAKKEYYKQLAEELWILEITVKKINAKEYMNSFSSDSFDLNYEGNNFIMHFSTTGMSIGADFIQTYSTTVETFVKKVKKHFKK